MNDSTSHSLEYILFRLESDYPSGYDYKILRQAAAIIREMMEDK